MWAQDVPVWESAGSRAYVLPLVASSVLEQSSLP